VTFLTDKSINSISVDVVMEF